MRSSAAFASIAWIVAESTFTVGGGSYCARAGATVVRKIKTAIGIRVIGGLRGGDSCGSEGKD